MPKVMPHPLSRIVDQLKREPSRTGSIVITLFGDAIVPRGGSVWLGTLLEFLRHLTLERGGVGRRLWRLGRAGWLDGNKAGRNGSNRLPDKDGLPFEPRVKIVTNPNLP